MMKIGFIGAGTVGTALATRLSEQGYTIVAVNSRTRASAERLAQACKGCLVYDTAQATADAADMIFITTPDAVIPTIVNEIKWRPNQSVIHCSGADSTEILIPAKLMGAATGAFHPLQTFASVKHALENLPGTTFAIEAEGLLKATLKEMTTALKGEWIELSAADKVVYHAAAVMACNYLVTLVKLADDLWETFGIPREQATKALLPLIRGTLNNIDNVHIPQALTGPIARGDTGTVQKHLIALKREAPDVLSTYCELGLQTIPIALAKGKIDANKAAELRTLLKAAFTRRLMEDKTTAESDALPVL
ncbi:MAG: DUF2520 domain-containing protein [Dehalococcoidales bacterium]|nr:DUF2520 domain-containing protein [Dehalococcoidales bacterium]